MKNLESKINYLAERKRLFNKSIANVLEQLHDLTEPLFERKRILGECGCCSGCCSNNSVYENGIVLGDIAITDGGACYKPCICVKNGYKYSSVYTYGNEELTDFGKTVKKQIIKGLQNIHESLNSKIEKNEKLIESLNGVNRYLGDKVNIDAR